MLARETCETSGKGVTGETDEGSRSEVRGFGNFEPRTSNRAFLSCLALHAPRFVALANFSAFC